MEDFPLIAPWAMSYHEKYNIAEPIFYLFTDNLTSVSDTVLFQVTTSSSARIKIDEMSSEYNITVQKGDNITIQANSSCNKPGIDYKWSLGRGIVTTTPAVPCTENPYFVHTQTEFHLENIGFTDTSVAVNVSHPLMWKLYLFNIQGNFISRK